MTMNPTAKSAALAAIRELPLADILTLREVRQSTNVDICDTIKAKLHPLPGVPSSTRKVRMLECLCDYERATLARSAVHSAILAALAAHVHQSETFGAF